MYKQLNYLDNAKLEFFTLCHFLCLSKILSNPTELCTQAVTIRAFIWPLFIQKLIFGQWKWRFKCSWDRTALELFPSVCLSPSIGY